MTDARAARRSIARPKGMRSLNAVTTTGTGTAFEFDESLGAHGIQVFNPGGSTAKACKVLLQGSISGSTYETLTTWSSTAGQTSGNIVYIADKPVIFVRASLTAKSTAVTSVTAWIASSP